MNQNDLQNEIKQFLKDSNWNQTVQDQISLIEMYLPNDPWCFIYEQPQCLAHQLWFISNYNHSNNQLESLLYSTFLEKYQLTKMKRSQLITSFTLLFSAQNLALLQKYIVDNYDEILTIEISVILTKWVLRLKELHELQEQMKRICPITMMMLQQFESSLPLSNEQYSFELLITSLKK